MEGMIQVFLLRHVRLSCFVLGFHFSEQNPRVPHEHLSRVIFASGHIRTLISKTKIG